MFLVSLHAKAIPNYSILDNNLQWKWHQNLGFNNPEYTKNESIPTLWHYVFGGRLY